MHAYIASLAWTSQDVPAKGADLTLLTLLGHPGMSWDISQHIRPWTLGPYCTHIAWTSWDVLGDIPASAFMCKGQCVAVLGCIMALPTG